MHDVCRENGGIAWCVWMEKEAVRPEQCMVVGGSCVCKVSKTERD